MARDIFVFGEILIRTAEIFGRLLVVLVAEVGGGRGGGLFEGGK